MLQQHHFDFNKTLFHEAELLLSFLLYFPFEAPFFNLKIPSFKIHPIKSSNFSYGPRSFLESNKRQRNLMVQDLLPLDINTQNGRPVPREQIRTTRSFASSSGRKVVHKESDQILQLVYSLSCLNFFIGSSPTTSHLCL